jgi:hypothetical protein
LVGIGDSAVAMVLLQARGAMDLGGGEITRAVERHQVTARALYFLKIPRLVKSFPTW